MKNDDLEKELRSLKDAHLSESEMVAYWDQELDQMCRLRVEAHVKGCFRCKRELALIQEENAALSNREIKAADEAFVERMMEQMGMTQKPSATHLPETVKGIPLRERLAEYLQQMVANWRIYFMQPHVRGAGDESEEIWQWQSEDGYLQARAFLEKNADVTINISSTEPDVEGVRLKFRLGTFDQEVTLQKVSESEVGAKVTIPRRWRPRVMADISIESI